MKQQPTKKQWDELSEDEQLKFLKVIIKSEIKSVDNSSYAYYEFIYIGDMIEYLGDDWWKQIDDNNDYYNQIFIDNKDLCNILWEAVKYKLKQ